MKASSARKIYIGAAIAVLLLAVTGVFLRFRHPRSNSSLQQISLRLPIPIVEAGSAPFFVAVDKGFYREEGLDVTINMGSRDLSPAKMVSAGVDTFGVLGGPDTLLVARSNGAPLTAIMVLHRNSNFPVLISLKSSKVEKPEDLQNQKVGFYYGHITTDVLRELFRSRHIAVKEVDVGFDYSPLINKQVLAEWGFRTTAGLDLPAKGIAIRMINPADYGIVSDGYTVFATDGTLTADPDMVERFTRATLRGIRYTVDHPEEANAVLINRDKTLDRNLSLIRLQMYDSVTSSSAAFPPGYMDNQMFEDTYKRLKDVGSITHDFDPDSAFTDRFTKAALQAAENRQP